MTDYRFYSYGYACLIERQGTTAFAWTETGRDGAARAGVLHTAHGTVRHAHLHAGRHRRHGQGDDRRCRAATGAGIVLGNTYHLMLRPGAERIAALGGLHRFMDWPGPILTDFGGFQVMSLAKLRKIDADGVTFQSHIDGIDATG